MKAERLWNLHFHCWLLFLWSQRKSVYSIKLFRCWRTLEYKSLWFCGVTRYKAAQYVGHVLPLLKGSPGTVRFKGVVWFVSSDSVNIRGFNVVIWEHCNGCSSDAVFSWMILQYTLNVRSRGKRSVLFSREFWIFSCTSCCFSSGITLKIVVF